MVRIKPKNLEKFLEIMRGLGFTSFEVERLSKYCLKRKSRGRPKVLNFPVKALKFLGPLMTKRHLTDPKAGHEVIPRIYYKLDERSWLMIVGSPISLFWLEEGPPLSDALKSVGVITDLSKIPSLTDELVKEVSSNNVPFPSWFATTEYDKIILRTLDENYRLPPDTLIISSLPFALDLVLEWKIDKSSGAETLDYLMDSLKIDVGEWVEIKKFSEIDGGSYDVLSFFKALASCVLKEYSRCIYCGRLVVKKSKSKEKFFCSDSHAEAFRFSVRKYLRVYPELRNKSLRKLKEFFKELGYNEAKKRYPLLVAKR